MFEFIGKTVVHLTICFGGCILYHMLDAKYSITSQIFDIIGVSF